MTSKQLHSLEELAAYTVATLPKNIDERKRVLNLLIESLPQGHAYRSHLREQLVLLQASEKAQLEFARVHFSQPQPESVKSK